MSSQGIDMIEWDEARGNAQDSPKKGAPTREDKEEIRDLETQAHTCTNITHERVTTTTRATREMTLETP